VYGAECYDLIIVPSKPQLVRTGSSIRMTCQLVNNTSIDTTLYDRPPMRWRAPDMRYIDDVTDRCVPGWLSITQCLPQAFLGIVAKQKPVWCQ